MSQDSRFDSPEPATPCPSSSSLDSNPPVGSSPGVETGHNESDPGGTACAGNGPLGWSGILAWVVVIGLTSFLALTVLISQFHDQKKVGGDASSMDLSQIQLQGRMMIGQGNMASSLQPQNGDSDDGDSDDGKGTSLVPVPESLDSGPYEQRLCYSILVNETEGPGQASNYLKTLDKKVLQHDLELTEEQTRLRESLGGLYQQYEIGDLDSSSMPDSEKELLVDRLQWLGELVLVPAGTPQTADRDELLSGATWSMATMLIGLLLGLILGLSGVVIVIIFIALAASRKLKVKFGHRFNNRGIYIETFAIWMVVFFGSSVLIGLIGIQNQKVLFALQPVVFFGSLVVLVWPVLRGISFDQVRDDIGWTTENPWKEALMGVPAYLATLPFLIPGVILAVVLMGLFSFFEEPAEFAREATPGHPIQELIMSGDVTTIALVFLIACVAAPIVEETMFRGVLYRYLRDATGAWRRWISVGLAAMVNGVIFASIHPQGIAGIPVLVSLAVCFSLTREWRNSLIGPMCMHAIHNSLITCFMLFLL